MLSPKVSIVIPVYNRQTVVRPAIESALRQTYRDIEVIIVDNCSTDNTFSVAQAYEQQDKRVRCHRNERNLGSVANWLRGVELSSGKYVKILFSDDFLEPTAIEEMVKPLEQSEEIGFVWSSVRYHEPQGFANFMYKLGSDQQMGTLEYIQSYVAMTPRTITLPFSPSAALFRRKDLITAIELHVPNSTGIEGNKYGCGNDFLIYLRCCEKYPYVYYLDQPLVNFRRAGVEEDNQVAHIYNQLPVDPDEAVFVCTRNALVYFLQKSHLPLEWKKSVFTLIKKNHHLYGFLDHSALFNQWIAAIASAQNRLFYRDQVPASLHALIDLVHLYNPTRIVELGTLSGLSLRTWLLADPTVKVTAVDLSFLPLQQSQSIIPLNLSRVTLVEQDILVTDFRPFWNDKDRVIFYVDAHDLPNVPIMEYVLRNVVPALPQGSIVVVDDVWFSPDRLTSGTAQAFLDAMVENEVDPLQSFEGFFAPYWAGGSFMGFPEIIPLLKWVNSHRIPLHFESGVKSVAFELNAAPLNPVPEQLDPTHYGVVYHDPLPIFSSPASAATAAAGNALRLCAEAKQMFAEGHNLTQILRLLDEANRHQQNIPGIHYARALCLAQLGQLEQALSAIDAELAQHDSNERKRALALQQAICAFKMQSVAPSRATTPLTIFAMPKAFQGHTGVIQRNAITSWSQLKPRPEIILFGNETGTAELAAELQIKHIPMVERNEFGTPLVNSIFQQAAANATGQWLTYLNADCILLDDFTHAMEVLAKALPQANIQRFLLSSQRRELDLTTPIAFENPHWQQLLRTQAEQGGVYDFKAAVEMFLFNRGLYQDIPPFAIGRTVWDNWLVWHAAEQKAAVIDASEAFMLIHQSHDYSHVKGGWQEAWKGEEAQRNVKMAAGHHMSISDACTHHLTRTGLFAGALPEKAAPEALVAKRLQRGLDAFQAGNFQSALDFFDDALSRCGTPLPHLHESRAHCLLNLRKIREAQEALKNELQAWPDNTAARNMLAQLALATEDPQAAPPEDESQLIPPEIKDDEFYHLIKKLSREEDLQHVLEIGSSSGEGSTEAFVSGLRQNTRHPDPPRLYCMEVSKPRFGELRKRYADDSFVRAYNVSSVPPAAFPDGKEVELFYRYIPTVLNSYPIEQVLGWLEQDLAYIRQAGVETDGIELIRRENGIDKFDMVLIDGSEFTGKAELDRVYGARIVLLDDINGFKNYANYKRLKEDPNYELFAENWRLRNGYAAFKRVAHRQELPVHFLTIVLNGEPFIRHHIEAFKALPFPWHWHIVEGVADLKRDTAWSLQFGGRITDELHAAGRSNDGTSVYLDELTAAFPDNVTVYRKPAGVFWDGKVEMVNAPLPRVKEQCLLWQLDSDELWTAQQITATRELFLQNPQKTAAYFHCDYFVGPSKYVSSLNTWATYPKDWIRVWRFAPGMGWAAHEPPILVDGQGRNVADIDSFTRDETKLHGITFQHFAYATEEQVRFKEIYYGYTNAVAHWRELQKTSGPVNPGKYLPWAKNDATVDDWPAANGALLAAPFFAAQAQKANQEQKDYFSMAVDGATLFEGELRRLFQQIRPATIIETGTYLGQGTSSIIWRALKDFAIPADFTTIEVNPIHHVQAVNHFRQNNMQINAELGLTLPRNMLPNQEEITDKFIRNKEYDGIYYDHDEADRAQYYFAETNFDVPENLLYKTMERYHFKPAFVLLDSAGHLGFAEFQYFMTLIKGDCYLMLDDIYHCKHYKTLQVIKKDPRFQILVESGEKFGFCIVKYTHVNSVLFVRPDSIGDNVLAAGMIAQLKKAYGGARIAVVCRQHLAELYESSPDVAEVIGFDRDRAYDDENYRSLMVQRLQAVKADLALNTLYSRELIGELFTIGAGARIAVAFDGNLCNMTTEQRQTCDPHYTRLITADPAPKTEIERNREFLQGLGIDAPPLQPTVWLTDEDERFAEEFFTSQKLGKEKTIALFAVGQWGQKVYDRYEEALGKLCRDTDLAVIAFGASGDKEINDRTLNGLGCRTINLAGLTSLRQAAALLKRCRLGVGADTGTAHLACAVDIPNVVMLGGGHFGRFFPYTPLTSVVCLPLECYHCNWECRYSRVHCIKDIDPQVLQAAVAATLAGNSDKPRVFVAGKTFGPAKPGEPAWRQVTELLDPNGVAVVTVDKPAAKAHLEPVARADRQASRRKVAGKRG